MFVESAHFFWHFGVFLKYTESVLKFCFRKKEKEDKNEES